VERTDEDFMLLALAQAQKLPPLASAIRSRIKLYIARKPFREAP